MNYIYLIIDRDSWLLASSRSNRWNSIQQTWRTTAYEKISKFVSLNRFCFLFDNSLDSRYVIFLRHIVVFSLYMCISRPEKNIPYLASLSVFVSQVTRGRTSLRYVTNVSKSLNKLNVSSPGSIKTKTRPVIFQLSKKDTTGDKRVCVCKVNIDCWRHKSKQKNESFSNYFFLHLHVER